MHSLVRSEDVAFVHGSKRLAARCGKKGLLKQKSYFGFHPHLSAERSDRIGGAWRQKTAAVTYASVAKAGLFKINLRASRAPQGSLLSTSKFLGYSCRRANRQEQGDGRDLCSVLRSRRSR